MPRLSNINLVNGALTITNSLFMNLHSTNGGSIEITQSNSNLLIIFCSFLSCYSTTNGGAIYFSSYLGTFNLDKCCSDRCYSSEYSFSYSNLETSTLNSHVLNRTTVSYCSPSSSTLRYHTTILYYGNEIVYSCNFSYNFIKDHIGGFSFHYSSKVYCSDNTVSRSQSDMNVGFVGSSHNGIFNRCNIVNNSKTAGAYGILCCHCSPYNLKVYNWIFLGNYISLFDILSGTTYLYDCVMDHYQYGRGAPVIGTCKTNIETQTFNLIYFQTSKCDFQKKKITLKKSNYIKVINFIFIVNL